MQLLEIKEDFLAVKKLVKPYSKKLAAELEKCNKILLAYKRECEDYQICENISNFAFALMRFGAAAGYLFTKKHRISGKEGIFGFISKSPSFFKYV